MKRAINRSELERETNITLVDTMWEQFNHLGQYEQHVINTTGHSIEDTVSTIKKNILNKSYLLTYN